MSKVKDFVKSLDAKPILIFGLGKSGLSCVKVLKDAGANIVIGDDNAANIAAVKAAIKDVETLDISSADFTDYAYLLLSPGIPLTHPKPHDVVEKARAAGLEIIGDIELFFRIYPDFKTIGVTGTNGKSTTTTLIHHILNESNIAAKLGGNIGTPIFEIDISDENQWLVLEMSSFQIDLCPSFRPDIAVILNLTPDHLDRHGDMDHYMEVKERITELSKHSEHNIAIICSDDPHTQKIYDRAKILGLREVIEVTTLKAPIDDFYLQCSNLSGIHDYQNVLCANAVVEKIGINQDNIRRAIQTFKGLNHRQYHVRTINGVDYINDSKATNAASSAVALACRENIYWIVGGRQKKNGLDGLEEFFPHIKHAFLIGEATEDFANWLGKYSLEYSKCYNLENALTKAHEMAQENRGQPRGAGIVLLSPACASFDQFKSFEDRGNKFTAIVKALEE